MNPAEWTGYFRQNARDRRGVAWHEPVTLPVGVEATVAHALRHLAHVERRDARRLERWTHGEAGRLLVAEKIEAARLLGCLLERLGETIVTGPLGIPFLTGPWSVAAVMVRDAVMLRFYGTLRATLPDPVARVVCDQILHDKKFHIRYLCALRGDVPRWVLRTLGVWAVISACWRLGGVLHAVHVPVGDFVSGCRMNLAAVQEAMYAGRDFTRDAADQLPPPGWPIHRVRG